MVGFIVANPNALVAGLGAKIAWANTSDTKQRNTNKARSGEIGKGPTIKTTTNAIVAKKQ